MVQQRLSNRHQAQNIPPSSSAGCDTAISPPPASATAPAARDAAVEITAPAQVSQQVSSPTRTPSGRRHDLRGGAARGTRSGHQETFSAYEWEALELARSKGSPVGAASPATVPVGSSAGTASASTPKQTEPPKHLVTLKMSRNRPRAPRDNGVAATEETELWTKIVGDLKMAQEKNDRQKDLAEQIRSLNERVGKEGQPTASDHDELEGLYRQMAKLCDEERAVLKDEPHDVLKNLQLLTALRQASEAEAPTNRAASLSKSRKKKGEQDGPSAESPGPSGPSVSEKVTRVKGTAPRSGSVSSAQARETREPRDNVAVKIEEGSEGTKGTIAERSGQLVVGAEVVFKHSKNKQGIEGEGIQCIIKTISGEGHRKRYDIQDPEPNENGEQGAVYRTGAASLIPIPQAGSALPSFAAGKQVLARYPDTTTFYRAAVMGSKKDTYRLKFEGEEDDKEMEVDKRFVLDIPGK